MEHEHHEHKHHEGYCPPVNPPTPCKHYKNEAVIVCDHYADYLTQTLPTNKFLFDRVVVVTSHEDKETQRVCEFNHVECLQTDVLLSRKGKFNKAAGINAGLDVLAKDGWVTHLDADIWLPPQSRLIMESCKLDPTFVYGLDRFKVRGYDAWRHFVENPRLQHEAGVYIHMNAFDIYTRVMQGIGNYAPIGYFQLWNPIASNVYSYPDKHESAARTDVLFATQWPRDKRGFIPELVCYHLETHDAHMAANWGGRKTSPFKASEERLYGKKPTTPDLDNF